MKLFPAIDLRGGKVVRLTRGDYDRMDVYGDDPAAVARGFVQAGAQYLHLVDLDGAKDGTLVNFDAIRSVAAVPGLIIEVGGGIRDEERIQKVLSLGVSRVILGTVAVRDFGFVERMAQKYGAKIAVGVDAADGMVAVSGWREVTDIPSLDFCRKLKNAGVDTVIYTDIAKDGELSGTNLEIYRQLVQIPGLKITASGGVSYPEEIDQLRAIGVDAVIVGKALYTGKLELPDLLRRAAEGGVGG